MSKIRETITALTTAEGRGAVRINRDEGTAMSDRRFAMVLKFATMIAIIAAGTVIVVFAEIWKLISLFVFGAFFSMIYFLMKD